MARDTPEGLNIPARGSAPGGWRSTLSAPSGYNNHIPSLLCPAGTCTVVALTTRGDAPGWGVSPLRGFLFGVLVSLCTGNGS